jgi:hypothetical protein
MTRDGLPEFGFIVLKAERRGSREVSRMAGVYAHRHYPVIVLGLIAFLVAGLTTGLGAKELKRAVRPEAMQDPCSFFRDCEMNLDATHTGALAMVCPNSSNVGHFTLHFNGVDNDFGDSTSMWFYVLEWDGQNPGMDEFILGLGTCIVRATFISACPAGYVVGLDAETGIYGVKWTTAPQIPELHISFLLDGIFPVGAMPFAVKAGGGIGAASICAPMCETQCFLDIECPPEITVACDEPTDPSRTGYPIITGTCPPFDTTYADEVVQDECPYVVERTWTVTDASGLVAECVQMINADDDTPPVITCPPDVDYECDDMGPLGEATAEDICDPDPFISYVDSVIFYRCPWEYIKKRIWTATDACGNSSSCDQIINIHDSSLPVITYCPPDITVACEREIDWDDMAEAEDTCNPDLDMRYEVGRAAAQDPCHYMIIRGWEFTDGCCNKVACHQAITVKDTVPPALVCADDDTIGCRDDVVFTDPAVTDNCGHETELSVVFTKVIPHCDHDTPLCDCTEDWQDINIRKWKAVDVCGNEAECQQTIYRELCVEGRMCTYTQGGWGSGCPDSQQDNPMSTQPGCIRDHYFDMVFPDGVMVGDTTGAANGAVWTTALAVEDFLPGGGPSTHLPGDLIDPTDTPAGNVVAQLLALRLSREYSCAGIWEILGLVGEPACLGDFVIPTSCGKFAGLTVDEFLALADQAVSGDSTVLIPYHADYSDVNETADCMNNRYDECWQPDLGTSPVQIIIAPEPEAESAPDEAYGDEAVPAVVTVRSQPNPLTGSTTITYSLPADGRVTVEIYNINGRRIASLVDAGKPAGSHGVIWNGKDGMGNAAASGVYFCRVRLESHPTVMEKLIKI